jgi:deazaflavin-dependent oxidoreductase (nitroreductase family)
MTTTTTAETLEISDFTPPAWVNSIMKLMLKTPVLERWLGRTTALITFTGRESGRRFTTPVGYYREDDTVIITSKKSRKWWRNLDTHPDVELRLAGAAVQGRAEVHVGDEEMLAALVAYFDASGQRARKFYGVPAGPSGKASKDDIRELLPHIAIVRVALR